MESFTPSSAGGYIDDCKTGESLYTIPNVGYEDGEFIWSTQDIYHIKNLRRFDFDLAVIIGMHSKSGSNSPVAHTLRQEISSLEIDGRVMGELGMLAHWLRMHRIPLAFVSGERMLAEEVAELEIPHYLYGYPNASVSEMARFMLTYGNTENGA